MSTTANEKREQAKALNAQADAQDANEAREKRHKNILAYWQGEFLPLAIFVLCVICMCVLSGINW